MLDRLIPLNLKNKVITMVEMLILVISNLGYKVITMLGRLIRVILNLGLSNSGRSSRCTSSCG